MHNDEASSRDERPAAKTDLSELEHEFEGRMEARGISMRNVAKELSRYKGEVEEKFDVQEAAMVRIRSDIFSKVDAFMSRSMKIDTDQTILIGRMNRLEDKIEKRGA